MEPPRKCRRIEAEGDSVRTPDLPWELEDLILTRVRETQPLLRMGQVCRRWRKVVTEHWKTASLAFRTKKPSVQGLEYVARSGVFYCVSLVQCGLTVEDVRILANESEGNREALIPTSTASATR